MFHFPKLNSGEGRNVAGEKEEMRKMGMDSAKPHRTMESLKPRKMPSIKPRKMGR